MYRVFLSPPKSAEIVSSLPMIFKQISGIDKGWMDMLRDAALDSSGRQDGEKNGGIKRSFVNHFE